MLNATWLDTFTTLCEVGHFTRTADKLGMTQPGVSQHLRKLEAQIGQPLMSRSGKSFALTPAGEALLIIGQSRRAQERHLRESIQSDDPRVGDVSIGCSGSFAMWLYPHLLNRMQAAPDLVLHLTAAPQSSLQAAVLTGELDIAIVTEAVDHPRLDVTYLGQEELCLVMPGSSNPHSVNFEQLEALGFVAHPDGYAYADDLMAANFKGEFSGADRLRVRTSVNQIGQIPLPVAQGLGYTILPRSGVESYEASDRLRVLNLPSRRYQDLRLIVRRGRSAFARIDAIRTLIMQTTTALM